MRNLLCGCSTCGCLCETHSPDGNEQPCHRHATVIVARWIAGEIATLVCLALVISSVAVWSKIIEHNSKNNYNYHLTERR